MNASDACPHDDVEIRHQSGAEWRGEGFAEPGRPSDPDKAILVQRGRCRTCGAEVARQLHGGTWMAWRTYRTP
jgi:hypothetical protein